MTAIQRPCIATLTALALCVAAATSAQAQATKPPAKRSLKPAAALAAIAALPAATAEQLTAAARAFFGSYACEFGQSVSVSTNAQHAGYIDVHHGKSLWTMKPVLSSTGALRLEDVKGRVLMLQIATKSMLMDTVVGRRLIDDCVHEQQRHAALPTPGQSLGIDPNLAAAAAAPPALTTTAGTDAAGAPAVAAAAGSEAPPTTAQVTPATPR